MSPSTCFTATAIDVRKSDKYLVKNVSIDVAQGELIGLIGPNGAGKSTLLATLAGVDAPSAGKIHLGEEAIKDIPIKERATRIGWLEQLGTVHWPISVERLIMLGRIPHLPSWGKPQQDDIDAVEHAISIADCQSIRHQIVTTLSGGERSRVLLARALAAEPTLLFADEPVSALDLGHQLQTMQLLRDFACENRAAIVVLHDLSLAARYCDRLYLMSGGEVVAHGEIAAVLSHENLEKVYGVSVISGCEQVPWIVPLERLNA
ncbi:MAG: ABC transporter ATP-binding protein [Granulosicoccus sp.]